MKKWVLFFVFLLGLSIYLSLHFNPQASRSSLKGIKNWAYQLQGKGGSPLLISELKKLPCDLIVMDYASTGEEETEFKLEDILSLKVTGKKVLAYLSVGEASRFRYYFKTMPKDLMERENPKWSGAFKVYYWKPEWKEIIYGEEKSMLDRILKAGFDGVYLDIVDAYQYFGFKENGGNGLRSTSAMDMIQLVSEIATYARMKNGNSFLVFVQNASAIVDPYAFPQGIRDNFQEVKQWQERYFKAIDAIGVEDLFFRGEKLNNNSFRPDVYVLKYLERFKEHQKPIFNVEYVQESQLLEQFFRSSKKYGFIPLAAERALDGSFLLTFSK